MRLLCDHELREGNKRKNVYASCKEIEEAESTISGKYYFCIQQMLIILALRRQ